MGCNAYYELNHGKSALSPKDVVEKQFYFNELEGINLKSGDIHVTGKYSPRISVVV